MFPCIAAASYPVRVRSAHLASVLLAAIAVALGTAGCTTLQRTAWQLNVPGVPAPFEVVRVERRSTFLDATLSSGNVTRRIFASADDPACRAMLVQGETLDWAATEPFGPLRRDDEGCAVIGIGDLERWRNSRGRAASTRSPIVRSTERYSIVYRGEGFILARGGFSIGALFGWSPGTDQALILIPDTPQCELADRDGFATLEYRPSGSTALGIVTRRGLCRVEGLISAPREVQS
jgi:hypothetical protein